MRKKYSNKFNAYKSVEGVLHKNRKLVASVPALAQTVHEFHALVDEISEVSTLASGDTSGETSAKNLAKENLALMASKLAASGVAYAYDISDTELEAALDYAYYKIRYAKDAATLEITAAIETELRKHLGPLTGYLVTEDDLADLYLLREKFDEAMKTKGLVKSTQVAYYRKMDRLFKRTDDLLQQKLDHLIFRIISEYPNFYTAYQDARKIVDR